jgi:hypothetical protein
MTDGPLLCACVHPDARECMRARSFMDDDVYDDKDDYCYCVCHDDEEEP